MQISVIIFALLFSIFCQAGVSHAAATSPIDSQIAQMTLAEKVGQLFFIDGGPELPDTIREYRPGGIVIFSHNAQTVCQLVNFVHSAQQASVSVPLLIAADYEGGRVSRLKFAKPLPSQRDLGNAKPEEVRRIGRIMGAQLRALGILLNFAPVLDVSLPAGTSFIAPRSFGPDPQKVLLLGEQLICGLHDKGIAATAKHFPGHGGTAIDSHFSLPTISSDRRQLQEVDIAPFRKAVAVGVDAIMVAHAYYPSLDPYTRPASLSPIVIDILRRDIGYQGLIITDSLRMKTITDNYGAAEAALMAIAAGADILLLPDDLESAFDAVLNAIQSGKIEESRIDQSVYRILNLKKNLGLLNCSVGKCKPGPSLSFSLEEMLRNALAQFGDAE